MLDKTQIGTNNLLLYQNMRVDDGPFEAVFEDDHVVVLKRVATSPAVDEQPQRDSCRQLAIRHELLGNG